METIEIISHWETLKKLIERENIYADMEIKMVDKFLKNKLKEELYGKE